MNNRFRLPLAAAALVISASTANAQVRPIPATKTPVALPPTGLVLPLVEPPGGKFPAPASHVPIAKGTLCHPKQTIPGPGPAGFYRAGLPPSGIDVYWPEVSGAVAYVIERAADGTNTWTLVGSNCGGPSPLERVDFGGPHVHFLDIVAGVVPGTTYVYKVTAIGPSGETGWNSTRWVAPATLAPVWNPPTITGSTVVLAMTYPDGAATWPPYEYVVTSDFGYTATVQTGSPFCAQRDQKSCKATVWVFQWERTHST